jgi:hypothetical protein
LSFEIDVLPFEQTTDSEARVMKMADGGFRPSYNVQFASDTQSGAVAGAAVDNNGSDMGKMAPMNEALAADYGERPRQHLADGGYAKFDDIEALILAGFWQSGPGQASELCGTTKADFCATRFKEALAICLHEAVEEATAEAGKGGRQACGVVACI